MNESTPQRPEGERKVRPCRFCQGQAHNSWPLIGICTIRVLKSKPGQAASAIQLSGDNPEKYFPYSRVDIVHFPNGADDPTFAEEIISILAV